MVNNELNHHGILGMKWGVRRYQNKDGSLTALGRKKKRKGEEDETPEERAAARQKALKSGSAADILKYKGEYSNEELKNAVARLGFEERITEFKDKDVEAGKQHAKKFFDNVEKATGYAVTGAKAWNMFANVYNAFGNNPVSLPKIDTDIVNGNRKLRKQENKEWEDSLKKQSEDKPKKEPKPDKPKKEPKPAKEPKKEPNPDKPDKEPKKEPKPDKPENEPTNDTGSKKPAAALPAPDKGEKYVSEALEGSGKSAPSSETVNKGRSYANNMLEGPAGRTKVKGASRDENGNRVEIEYEIDADGNIYMQ